MLEVQLGAINDDQDDVAPLTMNDLQGVLGLVAKVLLVVLLISSGELIVGLTVGCRRLLGNGVGIGGC